MAKASFSLDTDQVRTFWQTASPELAAIFEALEARENWVVDVQYEDIAHRLILFGERLKHQSEPAVLLEADRNDLLVFLVFITTSKSFRFIDYLNGFEQLGDRLLERVLSTSMVASNIDDAYLVRALTERLQIAITASYCRKIINTERINQFIEAVREYRHYQEEG